MEPLELVLEKIEDLRKDLSANIEDAGAVRPDTVRRGAAKSQLQQIYASCEWYSGRYKAGEAIGHDDEVLEIHLNGWIKTLAENMRPGPLDQDAESMERKSMAVEDLEYMWMNLPNKEYRKKACIARGYGPSVFWVSQHPFAALGGALATVAGLGAAAYKLVDVIKN